MRTRYRFVGRDGDTYYWESVNRIMPGDSRVQEIRCNVTWFWRKTRKEK
jgi:hypothetical protein